MNILSINMRNESDIFFQNSAKEENQLGEIFSVKGSPSLRLRRHRNVSNPVFQFGGVPNNYKLTDNPQNVNAYDRYNSDNARSQSAQGIPEQHVQFDPQQNQPPITNNLQGYPEPVNQYSEQNVYPNSFSDPNSQNYAEMNGYGEPHLQNYSYQNTSTCPEQNAQNCVAPNELNHFQEKADSSFYNNYNEADQMVNPPSNTPNYDMQTLPAGNYNANNYPATDLSQFQQNDLQQCNFKQQQESNFIALEPGGKQINARDAASLSSMSRNPLTGAGVETSECQNRFKRPMKKIMRNWI